MSEQKEKWRVEFNNLWLDFEVENGHIRSPANKYAFKSYVAARMTSQAEYDSLLKLLYERDCHIEKLEHKLALAIEALEEIQDNERGLPSIMAEKALEQLK